MKTKVYQVVSSSYETSDNYLHQESLTFTDEQKAREAFDGWRDSAKGDIEGDEDSDYDYEQDEWDGYYEGKREVGTEDEYQAIVELKELEVEVPEPDEIEVLYAVDTEDNIKHSLAAVKAGVRNDNDKTADIEQALVDLLQPDEWDDPDEVRNDCHLAAEQLSCGWTTDVLQAYDYEVFWDTVKMI